MCHFTKTGNTKMHSQTVWMLVFYLFCCFTSLLGYLLIRLNVWHTNHPSCGRFFSIPRQSGMYVSQWKKQSKGNHMKQKYTTTDLVLNKWQNIQENLCNELPFYSFKNGPKVFKKKHKNHHWIATPTSLLHGITMRNRDFTENLSHMARSVKKKQRWGIFMSWYTWNQWNIHAFKWQIGWWFLFFAMERWLDIIKPPSIHKWLAKWIPRYLFFMFRIGIPKFHGKFSRTKSNLRKLWSLIFGHTVSQTKKKSKTYRQIKNPCPLLLKNPL